MSLPEMFRGISRRYQSMDPTRERFRKSLTEKLRPHLVKSPELVRAIRPLSFKLMQELMTDQVRRSAHGARDPRSIVADAIGKDEIILTDDAGYKAVNADPNQILCYIPLSHLLIINAPRLIEEAKLSPDIPFELFVAHCIMHEQAHASSSRHAEGKGEYLSVQTGYQQATNNKSGTVSIKLYELLNEGVNESRAIELTRAYVKARPIPGVTHEHLDRLADIYTYKHTSTEYFVAMHILNFMIRKVAKDTGVSEDVVRKGFVHGEIAGLNLDSRDARLELDFDSIFGRGFTRELATIESANLHAFLKKYKIDMNSEFMRAGERYAQAAVRAHQKKHGRLPGEPLPGLPTSGNKGS